MSPGKGDLEYAARFMGLKASLRPTQGRFQEALDLLDRAILPAEPREALAFHTNRASCLDALGDLDGALTTLAGVAEREAASGRQRMIARHNRLDLLSPAGRFTEASADALDVRALANGGDLDLARSVSARSSPMATAGCSTSISSAGRRRDTRRPAPSPTPSPAGSTTSAACRASPTA